MDIDLNIIIFLKALKLQHNTIQKSQIQNLICFAKNFSALHINCVTAYIELPQPNFFCIVYLQPIVKSLKAYVVVGELNH